MTRVFEGKNFYEILELPLSAGPAEINRAYTEALEMYGEDALATYALFTEEQRKKVLRLVEEAFRTLYSREKRVDYDRMLISTGQVNADAFSDSSPDPAPAGLKDSTLSGPEAPAGRAARHSSETEFKELLEAVSQKELVSGEDLKRLREARGIDISEIFQRTRISRAILQKIEQNQYEELPAEIFLKSFLKSYAEILRIDSETIVPGYLKAMAVSG